jgi:hypothetical protein
MLRWIGLIVTGGVSLTAAPLPQKALEPLPLDLSRSLPSTQLLNSSDSLSRDPIAFLHACQQKSLEKVRSYRAMLTKQERIGDELYPEEVIEICVKEEPFSILLLWKKGERKAIGSAILGSLFVAGENRGRMKVWRPKAILSVIDVGTTDSAAKSSARYAINEGGIFHAMKRTMQGFVAADSRGILKVEYLGQREVPELRGRKCDIFRRTCTPPEVDGFLISDPKPHWMQNPSHAIKTLTIMIDCETGLQLGSELHREDGALIGSYYFDINELNPVFDPGTFSAKSFVEASKKMK